MILAIKLIQFNRIPSIFQKRRWISISILTNKIWNRQISTMKMNLIMKLQNAPVKVENPSSNLILIVCQKMFLISTTKSNQTIVMKMVNAKVPRLRVDTKMVKVTSYQWMSYNLLISSRNPKKIRRKSPKDLGITWRISAFAIAPAALISNSLYY